MVTRAVTGAIAGVVGALVTALACTALFVGFCGFEKPRPWDTERCIVGDYADLGLWLLPVVLLGGLIGTALLHVWLLKLRGQPRPWSVAAPGVALVFVLVAVGWAWGLVGLFTVPATAFAVAGVITGFGSWREIMRDGAR